MSFGGGEVLDVKRAATWKKTGAVNAPRPTPFPPRCLMAARFRSHQSQPPSAGRDSGIRFPRVRFSPRASGPGRGSQYPPSMSPFTSFWTLGTPSVTRGLDSGHRQLTGATARTPFPGIITHARPRRGRSRPWLASAFRLPVSCSLVPCQDWCGTGSRSSEPRLIRADRLCLSGIADGGYCACPRGRTRRGLGPGVPGVSNRRRPC